MTESPEYFKADQNFSGLSSSVSLPARSSDPDATNDFIRMLLIFLGIMILAFAKDPDLLDAIIHWLMK